MKKVDVLKRISGIAAVCMCLIMLIPALGACRKKSGGSSNAGENTRYASKLLKDRTPVYESYFKYFRALYPESGDREALVYAAKLSYCNHITGVTATEEETAGYVEKTETALERYRKSPEQTYEDICSDTFGITLEEYEEILGGYLLIEKLYAKLFGEAEAGITDEELAAYAGSTAEGGLDLCFLKAVFDGKKLPDLPEGVETGEYPEALDETVDFKSLLEKIGGALGGTEAMTELISVNGLETDGNIVSLDEIADGIAAEEKDGVVSSIKEKIKGKGGTAVYFDGKNYVLLYCIDYAEGYDETELPALREELALSKAEKAVGEYVSSLLDG